MSWSYSQEMATAEEVVARAKQELHLPSTLEEAIGKVIEAFDPSAQFGVSTHGHIGENGLGNVVINVTAHKATHASER